MNEWLPVLLFCILSAAFDCSNPQPWSRNMKAGFCYICPQVSYAIGSSTFSGDVGIICDEPREYGFFVGTGSLSINVLKNNTLVILRDVSASITTCFAPEIFFDPNISQPVTFKVIFDSAADARVSQIRAPSRTIVGNVSVPLFADISIRGIVSDGKVLGNFTLDRLVTGGDLIANDTVVTVDVKGSLDVRINVRNLFVYGSGRLIIGATTSFDTPMATNVSAERMCIEHSRHTSYPETWREVIISNLTALFNHSGLRSDTLLTLTSLSLFDNALLEIKSMNIIDTLLVLQSSRAVVSHSLLAKDVTIYGTLEAGILTVKGHLHTMPSSILTLQELHIYGDGDILGSLRTLLFHSKGSQSLRIEQGFRDDGSPLICIDSLSLAFVSLVNVTSPGDFTVRVLSASLSAQITLYGSIVIKEAMVVSTVKNLTVVGSLTVTKLVGHLTDVLVYGPFVGQCGFFNITSTLTASSIQISLLDSTQKCSFRIDRINIQTEQSSLDFDAIAALLHSASSVARKSAVINQLSTAPGSVTIDEDTTLKCTNLSICSLVILGTLLPNTFAINLSILIPQIINVSHLLYSGSKASAYSAKVTFSALKPPQSAYWINERPFYIKHLIVGPKTYLKHLPAESDATMENSSKFVTILGFVYINEGAYADGSFNIYYQKDVKIYEVTHIQNLFFINNTTIFLGKKSILHAKYMTVTFLNVFLLGHIQLDTHSGTLISLFVACESAQIGSVTAIGPLPSKRDACCGGSFVQYGGCSYGKPRSLVNVDIPSVKPDVTETYITGYSGDICIKPSLCTTTGDNAQNPVSNFSAPSDGAAGGFIYIIANKTLTLSGTIQVNGFQGTLHYVTTGEDVRPMCDGSGAGGVIYIFSPEIVVAGSVVLSAVGEGCHSLCIENNSSGGGGSRGVIILNNDSILIPVDVHSRERLSKMSREVLYEIIEAMIQGKTEPPQALHGVLHIPSMRELKALLGARKFRKYLSTVVSQILGNETLYSSILTVHYAKQVVLMPNLTTGSMKIYVGSRDCGNNTARDNAITCPFLMVVSDDGLECMLPLWALFVILFFTAVFLSILVYGAFVLSSCVRQKQTVCDDFEEELLLLDLFEKTF